MQANFLLIKDSPSKIFCQREFTKTFFLSKRVQEKFLLFRIRSNQDFSLLKRLKANFLLIKENASNVNQKGPRKLSVCQRESKQTFCKENLSKLSVYQIEPNQTFVQCQLFSQKYLCITSNSNINRN